MNKYKHTQNGFMSMLLVLLAVVVVIITVSGYYLYLSQDTKNSVIKKAEINTASSVGNTTEKLNKELEEIDTLDIDSDFKELDQDIDSL